MTAVESETHYMQRAVQLAARGEGMVEPNPMVGCVIVRDDQIVGEGWHELFGGPHAELQAIRAAGERARGATMFVTLEPCCHQGKTPPCTQAVIAAGIRRIVIAPRDPFGQVDGGGLAALQDAGMDVSLGLLEPQARSLNAPYLTLVQRGRPWMIAKWAMSLDGKIATGSGDSKWISNEQSRAVVHQIRGRVDGILVGRGTVEADDPLLTARPAGPRTATRVVLDSLATISLQSNLVRSAGEAPVLMVTSSAAPNDKVARLQDSGCEVYSYDSQQDGSRLSDLLAELGRRRMTNVLVEGGATVLGTLSDIRAMDELHVFVAPKIVGGQHATTAVKGVGVDNIADAMQIEKPTIEQLGGDVHIFGRV